MKGSKFVAILFTLFVMLNLASAAILGFIVSDFSQRVIIILGVFTLSVFVIFVLLARRVIVSVPRILWLRFVGVVLTLVFLYAVLSLALGKSLLDFMGYSPTVLPPDSPISLVGYEHVLMVVIGLGWFLGSVMALTIGYVLQRFMVRGLYQAYKRIYKSPSFFLETNREKEPSVLIYALLIILLPFSIQYALSKLGSTSAFLAAGATVLLPSLIPAVLVIFALWGLRASGIVGTTKRRIFRLSEMWQGFILSLAVLQWIWFVLYVFSTEGEWVDAVMTIIRTFASSVFLLGPPGIIVAYFYSRFLRGRAEERIVEYLSEKEDLVEKVLTIGAE